MNPSADRRRHWQRPDQTGAVRRGLCGKRFRRGSAGAGRDLATRRRCASLGAVRLGWMTCRQATLARQPVFLVDRQRQPPGRHQAARLAARAPAARSHHAADGRRSALGGSRGAARHGGHRSAAGCRGRQPPSPAAPAGRRGRLGTAITVDLVAADGAFCGGAILPGIGMSARHCTSSPTCCRWWRCRTELPPPALGTATVPAMHSGLFWGAWGRSANSSPN